MNLHSVPQPPPPPAPDVLPVTPDGDPPSTTPPVREPDLPHQPRQDETLQ